MVALRSPVLGYNTNVRHAGKLFHIQTEDSGLKHPHVITHLFADGGRIVASTKSSYATHLGAENLHDLVKQLMREQHKAMFIALRDGHYDEPSDSIPPADGRSTKSFERGAPLGGSSVSSTHVPAQPFAGTGQYQVAAPAIPSIRPIPSAVPAPPRVAPTQTLDEVILSYLAADLETATQA